MEFITLQSVFLSPDIQVDSIRIRLYENALTIVCRGINVDMSYIVDETWGIGYELLTFS